MLTIAYSIASFLSFLPSYWQSIIVGAFAVLALYVVIKLVIAVLNAIPFL